MTKRFFMLLAVAMAAVVVHAENFTVNGIKYTGDENTKTATVTGTEDGFNQTDLVIPETVNGYTVTSIGYGAFERSGLHSVHIPASVKKVESFQDTHWPFRACFQLTKITIAEDNPVYDSRNGCNAIIETATNKLIEGCAGTVIPENVVTIGASAFESCPFKTIEIPNSVTNIEKFAFYGCTKLENINLPDNITTIAKGTFISCDSLRSVKLPKNLKSIENDAFYECKALESIEFPAGLTKIGANAFDWCEKIASLLIPASVSEIEREAFNLCDGLTTIQVEQGNTVYDSRENCNAIIKTADNEIVLGCQTTVIPQSVTSIGDRAFQGFAAITEMTLPDGLTHIGRSAFARTTITSITLPASLTSIGSSAFNGSFLKTVTSYIQEPFEIEGGTFSTMGGVGNGQTLYVPKGCTNKYKATKGWNWFEFIREIGEAGQTGIRPVHTTPAATDSTWYTLDGRRVKQPAAKGIYISNGRKVVVR